MNNRQNKAVAGWLLVVPAVLLTILGTGCVVIPVKENEVTSGRRIEKKETAAWRVGETTRQDVLQQLGKPYADFQDLNVTAYDWTVVSAILPWVLGGAAYSGVSGSGGVEELRQEHLLLVGFDEADRLAKFEVVHHDFGGLRAHAERWVAAARTQGARVGSRGQGRTAVDDIALLYVYRPGGWAEGIYSYRLRVLLDGQLVAELKRHSYAQIKVPAGSHLVQGSGYDHPVDVTDSLNFKARTNETTYLEARITSGTGKTTLQLRLVPPDTGLEAIRELKQVEATP